MLGIWKKLAAPMSLVAALMLVAGFSGRVLCFSDFHVAIESEHDEEQDCENNCGDCTDVPLPQLNAVPKASTDNLFVKIIPKLVIASVDDDEKHFFRFTIGNSLPPLGVDTIVSGILLALRTIVLLN